MRTHRGGALAVAVACASLALIECGGDDPGDGAQGPDGMTTTMRADRDPGRERDVGGDRGVRRDAERQRPGITITTAGSQFGRVLFDADRRATYYFAKETLRQGDERQERLLRSLRRGLAAGAHRRRAPSRKRGWGETPGNDAAP